MKTKDIKLSGERMKTELIEEYITKNNLSKTQFCNKAKISVTVLNKMFKQQINFSAVALFRVCFTIGIQPYQFFEIVSEK